MNTVGQLKINRDVAKRTFEAYSQAAEDTWEVYLSAHERYCGDTLGDFYVTREEIRENELACEGLRLQSVDEETAAFLAYELYLEADELYNIATKLKVFKETV